MKFGTLVKTLLILAGLFAILAVCGNMFELKDPNQPRLPVPTQFNVPKVNVSR